MFTFRRALLGAAIFIITLYSITHKYRSFSTSSIDALHNPSAEKAPSEAFVYASDRNTDGSQQPLTAMSHASLRDRLTYQYPYDREIRFPAYIWQTWKFTPASGEFKESYRPSEASWTELHPSFIHEVITDQVAVHLLRHLYASVPEILEAYTLLPLAILKADFFRYLILFARGGIYSDIDTQVIRSAVEWLPESVPRKAVGLIIGLEADPFKEEWAFRYSRRLVFCQWTMQSKPGHPILREVIARITENTLERAKNGTLSNFSIKDVYEFTGSVIWTDVIFSFFNDKRYFDMDNSTDSITWKDFTGMKSPKKIGDVVVLPITSFSPGISQMGAEGYDNPLAFVRHEFAGTWRPESEKPKEAAKS